jgi:tRNA(adenine34) deaminase
MAGPGAEALVRTAMALAAEAGERGDPPFGAILVDPTGTTVARAANRQATGRDPTAHAEVEVIRVAARGGHGPPLVGYTIAVNAEPCSMCTSLLVKAGVTRIVFGAPHESHMDPDLGLAEVLARSRRAPAVLGGVLAGEAAAQIAAFRSGHPPLD